jgi:hypothetical protein
VEFSAPRKLVPRYIDYRRYAARPAVESLPGRGSVAPARITHLDYHRVDRLQSARGGLLGSHSGNTSAMRTRKPPLRP